MSKRVPAEGDTVAVLDVFQPNPNLEWVRGTVENVLNIQFTARTYDGKRVMFAFFRDHGTTWRYVDE